MAIAIERELDHPVRALRARYDALFLDRDGVINENRSDHVKGWSEFRFLPGAIEAMRRLRLAGHRLFVITNQAVIGRGVVSHHISTLSMP